MTDVLLIQPPIRDFYLTAKRTIPYGLACIAAVLEEQGFATDILDGLATSKSRTIDLPREMTHVRRYYSRPDRSPFGLFYHYRHFGYGFDHFGRAARDSGAFLVGISALFTPYFPDALRVAEAVKQSLPGAGVVVGGHHATALPLSAMESPAVDFVLRGEGEVSMPLLARALKTGTDPASIPGIVFRKPDGTVHVGDPAFVADPDRLPLPASHWIERDFYRRKDRGSAVVVASRGCPLACSYCSVGASSGMPYRRRTAAAVVEEIDMAVRRFNAGFIDFEDENLSFDREWFLDLLQRIRGRFDGSPPELRAMNGLLPSTLDAETVYAMRAAGFKSLNLSLGSTSSSRLRHFNRPDVREAFDRVLDLAEANDLTAVGYVIAAAPGQSARESLADLLYLAERRVLAAVSVFYPAPGSRDFERCRALGILPETFSMMRSSALPLSHTTARKEAATLLRLARILNFMKYLKDLEADGGGGREPDRRVETGRRLLEMFLADGRIRGITPDGEIFEHDVSPGLTARFIASLKHIRIRGTR